MDYRVTFTPEAEQQIVDLHRYITEQSSQIVADGFIDALLEYLEGFSTFPERGNKRDDIRPGLRVTHFRHRTVIAFAVDGDCVLIAGVYYGGQNYG
ncbi:type II toxin-antitoxin system RelE/ParE family toxin [Yersinia enterocolitica]|uniref:type II toxin-antitoxin system RelE/ParE family toxin n=1 Tax=Yersinia enterocolitica TaxID=630 RepID=UPI0025AAEB47|nr:type II toxin-antitoxin system RelE/ParE family toxin [Yersinia enterocolitica]ELI7923491.1 type II toxin-antitoxin system RelE/ParE family toxin [Yersinia enterocolitica]MDN0097793.1 type II toxin-antitoxin system RelE/ParE family toxin [Yersinia enterocolitica]HEI6727802.1 type II toxin-antitoxin system RelE/ParE family toxin [Yersinia enterocolitica]HEI6740091.1 type II toxin-antitoxin system RelE/ParE family toxin [Yersinia enterocolitica]HEI6818180.1 type II toxin-antitoxin system RelE